MREQPNKPETKEGDPELTNQELRRKNEELEQFISTIAHDLKTPIASCQGFAELLQSEVDAGNLEVVKDCAIRIERATARMSSMIENLLHLSRFGSVENKIEAVDPAALLLPLIDDLKNQPMTDHQVSLNLSQPLPTVDADRGRLLRAFDNLIQNAIKYGRRDDRVEIEIGGQQYEDDDEIRFYVRDHGPGIAEANRTRIFDLFQRLSKDDRGTGVGLAAVKRIIESHGGRVWVESELGLGSTFWMALPQSQSWNLPGSRFRLKPQSNELQP